MKHNIDAIINAIVRDNAKFIVEGGYDSVAEYIISKADNSDQGWHEYFDDEEKEFGLTDEQIEECKNYLLEHYNYLPEMPYEYYIVKGLELFLRDETLDTCPITIKDIDDIEGEEAELIRFTFGKDEESCVAVRYNDGTIYTPTDWTTPVWDNEDWQIEDSEWMDADFNRCINFNGMPRRLI